MMNILIPFNSKYVKNQYNASVDFLEMLSNEVLPHILDRFSSDERVQSIEIISDVDLEEVFEPYSKAVLTKVDIGVINEPSAVVQKLLAARTMKSPIVVQVNLLYPFISINSLFRGYSSVNKSSASSALGAITEITSENNLNVIDKSDLGIFTVYREATFMKTLNRVSGPVHMIGIRASEMISLRSKLDIELYDLIINSGYEL